VFDCAVVFEGLYKSALEQGIHATADFANAASRSNFVNLVKDDLLHLFEQFQKGKSAVNIHRSTLERFKDQWKSFQSGNTCFCCMLRRPLYDAPCGHSVCENCVVVFGHENKDDPWLFHVRRCFLCSTELPKEATVRVHPPTAGATILSLDGGGTRGIAQLMQLKLIQNRLGLPIPLPRFFKVVFGVSIGQYANQIQGVVTHSMFQEL
jgi:hypothetical protein